MLLIAPATAVGLLFLPVLFLVNPPNSGILFGQAQQFYNACDSGRLFKCQQDALRDIQSQGQQIGQYQLGNGPPYSTNQISPSSSGYASTATCRSVRYNLDCLLSTTPACYNQGAPAAQNTDVILRAKRFLEQNQCNQPDITWQNSHCYKSPDIHACEERFGFSLNSPSASSYLSMSLSSQHSCTSYQSMRQCAELHVRVSCKNTEMDMLNEYLIDKASDLAWRCVLNGTSGNPGLYYGSSYGSGGYGQYPSTVLSPQSSQYSGYEQRPAPPYIGGGSGGLSQFNSLSWGRDRSWDTYRDPDRDRDTTYSRLNPLLSDRLTFSSGSGFDVDSNCPNRAAPFTRECEENLLENQRNARDGTRRGEEVQRRICCALYQYRDCISRVVLDRCPDSSPTAVDVLMSTKKHDFIMSCRDYSRDYCSGSVRGATVTGMVVALASAMASMVAFRSSKSWSPC